MDQVAQLLNFYPRIYFACHMRHVPDPKRNRTLSSHQASVLDHLDEIEPTGLLALAAHMGVTASTMSLMIDRLARGGYVIRGRDAKDGRRVKLRLTKAGVRIKSQQKVLDPERVRTVLGELTPAEREQALHGMELLARASVEAMQKSGAGKAARSYV
ncbi:MAG TPA: MarR family transcriptional regulator [Bryobacteraceae bacterium]|nr:MarR family transcriptional regulator [Bryobacteraceae bacterium]